MRRMTITSAGRLAIGVLAAALLLSAGCRGPKEPPRYSLSGKVTYRGAPVPHGAIFFLPDRAKGNDGPSLSVPIVKGAYKTLPGRGTTGGPYVATVTSYEFGPSANLAARQMPTSPPLFPPCNVSVNLPKQDATHDFERPRGRAERRRNGVG